MNRDHATHHLGEILLPPDVEPAPRPAFYGVTPHHQPISPADTKRFLDRTAHQPGHTFTESGRS